MRTERVLFNSYEFIFVFMPVVLVVLFILARWQPWLAPPWLLLASVVFYGWWNERYVGLLIASILVNFAFGRMLSSARKDGEPRTTVLALGVAFNLLLLGYYKYVGLFSGFVESLTGIHAGLGDIVLPIGISFFTFTQIAYLVDAYRGLAQEYDLVRYSLFVTYFPHLVAGPILHHGEVMPQFRRPDAFQFGALDLSVGGSLFVIGLAKKVLLADSIAPAANVIFNHAGDISLTWAEAWTGALAYTMQIYFDFSGYSDMALGLSRMIGVRLPLNFDSPYQATSIIEFWRRWHMTLSRFLRDYLYIPLGGNRRGVARRYANRADHHGAWRTVAWGRVYLPGLGAGAWRLFALKSCLEGVARRRCEGQLGAQRRRMAADVHCRCRRLGLFRAGNLGQAFAMLQAMIGANGGAYPQDLFGHGLIEDPRQTLLLLAGLLAVVLFMPNSQSFLAEYQPVLQAVRPAFGNVGTWRPSPSWAVALGLLFAACLTLIGGPSPFLYFQF